jgi:predicted nuclease of predicted toxin-antitoxin system
MKFLVDAQLPRRLARQLASQGHDVLHALDLPQANLTTDEAVLEIAARDSRVVVTKDRDFVNSFAIRRVPAQLLLVTTGNISNQDLEQLFLTHLPQIEAALTTNQFVELSSAQLTIHS